MAMIIALKIEIDAVRCSNFGVEDRLMIVYYNMIFHLLVIYININISLN